VTRRRTFAAIAIVTAILITAGLGARRGNVDDASEAPCSDLEDISEMCSSELECAGVSGEFADACHAACMMGSCPEQVGHTAGDPIWRAPCADMRGARFWRSLREADIRCENKLHFGHVEIDRATFFECYRADAEQHCPELAGTDWWTRFQAGMGKEGR